MNLSAPVLILLQGALLITSINCTIGPLNLLILRQGARGQHLLPMALTCVLCDLLLVGAGLAGLSGILASNRLLLTVATWGGVVVLLYYGGKALYEGWFGGVELVPGSTPPPRSRNQTVLAILAISLLDPSVYLQTVVLVGGVGSQYAVDERWLFGVGVALASTLWFLGLTYGAASLLPLLRRPQLRRSLDLLSGGMMWLLALSLVW